MNAVAVMETSKLSGRKATCVPIYQPVMVTAATRMHVSASFSRESFKMAIKKHPGKEKADYKPDNKYTANVRKNRR